MKNHTNRKNCLPNHFFRLSWVQMLFTGLLLPGLTITTPVLANPLGGVVVHGDVSIGTGGGGNLQINQASNQAIIDWSSFSINSGELTQFVQPGAGAAVLNRVTGGDPSAIHGALKANGNVFVINPNGILVGAGGTIDVHGLALSTLDVSNGEFLAGGDMVFKGAGEGVTNMGRINAVGGDVFLIGKTVTNSGAISASGTVGLAAGEEVLLKAAADAGGERVFVRAAGSGVSGTGILNDGTIEGAAVELKAHGNMYALAINNKGSIRATGAEASGGRVFLQGTGGTVSNSGSIRATAPSAGSSASVLIEAAYAKVDGEIRATNGDSSGGSIRISGQESAEVTGTIEAIGNGGSGGAVIVEGDEVVIGEAAHINVSGEAGGTINIGGGFQGRDSEIENAELTGVASGAVLNADAVGNGDAGSVIVWANDTTEYFGAISADAAGAGNGGFVEVSGKKNLLYRGTVSTLSAGGENGALLLDPTNFAIVDGVAGLNEISEADLETQLASGSVIIATDATDPGAVDDGNITVSGGVGWSSNSSLALLAHGDILFNAGVQTSGIGNVTAIAGWDGSTGFAGTTGSAQTGTVNFSDFTSDVDSYGNAKLNGGNGSVIITGGSSRVAVGSAGGTTSIAGYGLEVNGADFSNAAAIVGYYGSATGGIAVTTKAGGVSLAAGNDNRAFAKIGHGLNRTGSSASGSIDIDTTGSVTLQAGGTASQATAAQDVFAQIGHGGILAPGNFGAEVDLISVSAGTGVSLLASAGDNAYAVIGNGGLATNGTKQGDILVETTSGNIQLVSSLSTDTTRDDSFAQIGHIGVAATGNAYGNIAVTASDGDVLVRSIAGSGSQTQHFAQIGHGGAESNGNFGRVDSGGVADSIEVTANTISVLGGALGSEAQAQIGHGGGGSSGTKLGDISLVATSDADDAIRLVSGASDDSYAQVGHGGLGASGTASGTISIQSAGGVILDGSAGGVRAYVQIGHGGQGHRNGDLGGTVAGGGLETITVDAADNIELYSGGINGSGYSHNQAYAMIGNGGYDADANGSGVNSHRADITLTAGTDGSGSVILRGTSAANISDDAFVLVGNGGTSSSGGHSGDVTVTAADEVRLNTGDDSRNYAQIGNGGYNADGNAHSGDITVTATNGSVILEGKPFGSSTYYNAVSSYAMIGNGGGFADGNHFGDIEVTSGNAITLSGGRPDAGFEMIGHGGYQAKGDFSGSIEVTAQNDIDLLGGTNDYTFAQIGHGGYDADGNHTAAFINVTSVTGSIDVIAGSPGAYQNGNANASNVYAQIGLGGVRASGNMSAPITVQAEGNINLTGGGNFNDYSQIGNGGHEASGDKSGAIGVTSTLGSVNLTAALRSADAYAQIGHGGVRVTGTLQDDISVSSANGITVSGGTREAENSYAQIGHGGLESVGNKSGAIELNSGLGLSVLGGTANQAFALVGHGGVRSEGFFDGGIDITLGAGLNVLGGSGATAGQEGDLNFAMIGHSLTGAIGGFGGFMGSEGRVVVEAEYFDSAVSWVALDEGTLLTSQQDGSLQYEFTNVRGGAYVQAPDGGTGTGPGSGSVVSYTFTVAEDGTYRLIPKAVGYNGNSDSLYFSVAELRDGTAADGSNVNADWYEFTGQASGVFNWDTSGGGAELNIAGDPNDAPLWDLVAGQTYTMEVRAREDGVAVDTWALELDSQYDAGNYSADGPGVTWANKSGVSGASDISISAAGNIQVLSGANSDSYAAIGHGGSAFEIGVSANVNYGTSADGADISVVTSSGDIQVSGNSVAGASGDAARRYASIGHHGVDAGFNAYGDVEVHAAGGEVSLSGGEAIDSFAQIGHGSAGDFIDAQSTLSGDICVIADNGVSLSSLNNGLRSYTQIGHGAFGLEGDFSGNISVATTAGDVVLTGGALSTGQYAQIGHGGSGANGELTGDIEVAAVAGDVTVTGSNDPTNYGMVGHGAGDGTSAGVRGGGVQLFAGDILSAVNGTSNNAFVFHQTAGGLNAPGAYLGGNGFQLIGANGVTLPDSAMGGISAMITGNIANGPVFIATDYDDGAITIDVPALGALNDDLNRVIAVGGDITLLSSLQNAGAGDVMLLAGYNGDGTVGGSASFNAANCEVTMNGSLVADFNNCAAAGSTLTIGSSTQTAALVVGSRTGATSLGAETITLTAGNNVDAYSQVGFFTTASGAASGEISIGAGSGGLTMTSGNADGAYTQIGHGGNNTSTEAVSADITISFCEPGNLVMNAGDGLAAYTQIGHGGNENNRDESNVESDILITGFNDLTMSSGDSTQAYAQVGHGGFSGSGFDGGNIDLDGSGSLQMAAGGLDAYAQIGHGGTDQINGTSLGDRIDIQMGSFVSLGAGSGDGAYAQIGHGGAGSAGATGNLVRSGDITVNAGGADGSGNAISIQSGSGDSAYAQIGLGGSNADSSYTGNIDIDAAGDVEMISSSGANAYAQIGHGGRDSFDTGRTIDDVELEQAGDIKIDTTAGGSLNLQGNTSKTSGALGAYTQVGHGGSNSSSDTDGEITIDVAGGISLKAGGDATGNSDVDRNYSQIGHGGYNADGRKNGDIDLTSVDAILLYGGIGEIAYAQIGHGGFGEDRGANSGDISVTTTGAGGNLDMRGGQGGDGWNIHSYSQIGHGGRVAHGEKTGDITLSIAGGIGLINGNHDGNYKLIGHGGSSAGGTVTGAINVTANGNVDLIGGSNDLTAAQIGHGGSDGEGNIDATAVTAANTSGVNVTSQTGRVLVRGGSYNGDGGDGRRAYAQIGLGGFSFGTLADTFDGSISVDAANGVIVDGGGRDFNYGMIGNGGSLSEGTRVGDIMVTAQNGAVSVYASEKHELAFAQIGHGGFRGMGTAEGSIHVKALNDTVSLRNGGGIDAGTDGGDFYTTTPLNASYSYAQIGHGGAQAGDYDRDGEICVVGINGVSLSSSEAGDHAYTQIGHGGVESDGELTGGINVVSTAGGVTVTADGTGSEGQYAQIGHGGLYSDGRMSANISVVSGAGNTLLEGGDADLSFAMIGNGDGSRTSTGSREGGIHLFSSGQLIGTNGAGNESNVFIFHQNANGLLAADYEGGDGYQKVANGGINLAASATVDESTVINGNLGNGTITIVDNSMTDYTIDASNIGNGMVDTPEDFYIITGGNITMETSFQNSGVGDVTLLAGWNGSGAQLNGTVEFGDPVNFCEPIIKAGGYDVDFTNCETFGNNGKVLTIGSVDQTTRVSVGSAGGTNTFAGATVNVLGSNDVASAGTQLGYFADGTTDIVGAINVYAKDGGLLLDGGTTGSFAQIGHGGSGSTSGALLDAPITITFCADSPAAAIDLLGGSDGAYAQIGHGGPTSGGAVSGKIDINGAGSLTMTSGGAYTQIGHGGDNAGLTEVTNSDIEIDVRSFIDLNSGTGTFDYAQIGHVGRNPQNTDVLNSNILINTGTDQTYGTGAITLTGGASNSFVQIGHGGARNDGSDDFTTHSGDITIGKALSITVEGGTATDAYAQIGHGGEGGGDGIAGETAGDFSGNISIVTEGLLNIIAGGSQDTYAQVGHGGEQSLATKSGNVRIEAGSISLSGLGGSDAYSQIGHGGELADGDASGAISIISEGNISLAGGTGASATAQIGHGSGVVNSAGSRSGELNIFTQGSLTLTDGASTSALISHQTTDSAAAVDYGLIGENDSSYSVVALGGINMASDSDQKVGAGDVISFAETLGVATASGDVTVISGGNAAFEVGNDGTDVSFSGSGDLSILSGGDLDVTGSLSNAGSGSIGLLAGWANTGSTAVTGPDVSVLGVPNFTPVAAVGPVAASEFGLNGSSVNIGDGNQTAGISIGSQSGTTTVIGDSVNLTGSSLAADSYSQVGFRGDATGSIVVQAGAGGIALDGGDLTGSYSQIGHGGSGSTVSAIDASITAVTTGAVSLSGGIGEGSYAQIGNGGTGVSAVKDGDVTVTGASVSLNSSAANSYTQIGSGGLMTRGDVDSTIRVTSTVGGIALNAGGSDNAFSLIGSGGAIADGQLDGDIIVNSAAGVDVLGGGTAGDAFSGTRNFAQIGHSVQGFFIETIDGLFFVDALDYTTRHASWVEVPNEGASNPAGVYSNATDGDFLHLPDGAGGLGALSGSAVTYEVEITTTGTYQLLPRWVGYDAGSDSVFFDIVELKDGAGGAIADYYEFAQGGTGDFNSVPFTTVGGAEQSDGSSSGHTAATFDFNTAGTYTVRITPREDGVAVDSFVLQLANLPSTLGPNGPNLTRDVAGVGGMSGDISVTAVGDINLVAGINSDSYATIGHGGTDRSGGNHASVGSAGDTADITVTTTTGDITLDGGQSMGDNAGTIRRYAAIGHHGAEGQFDSYGDIQVEATGGSLLLNSGAIEDSTARIGHGGELITGSQSGTISASALNDIILTSGAGMNAETQIGHSAALGTLTGALMVTAGGSMTLNAGTNQGASSQFGHGGNLINAALSGPLSVNAGGALNLNAGGTNSYVQIGQGGNNSNGSKDGDIDVTASEISLSGGAGTLATARIGNGGAVGTGDLTGSVNVTSSTGDITLTGNGTNSGAQIGSGGRNYTGEVVDQSVTVESANDIILSSGGLRAATLIGNGGGEFSASTLSGDVSVTAFNSISLTSGGVDAFSQIGNGGTSARADISGTTSVTASGGDITLDGSSSATGAYAKIGHGDDLVASIGRGDRSGDIVVASATDITLTDGMIGQINSTTDPVYVTSLSGITQVGVSQLDPSDESGGDLTADAASEFQGTDSLEFYLAQRENNEVAAGAMLNGISYAGARQDATVVQLAEEFAVNVINPDGSTVAGNIADNLIGASRDTAGTTPQNYGFYFDTIALMDAPPVINDPTDADDAGNSGFQFNAMDWWSPLNDRLVDDERREAEQLYTGFNPYSMYYEGYDQYDSDGNSIFNVLFTNGLGQQNGGN